MERAHFIMPREEVGKIPDPKIGASYIWDFIADKDTPGRALNDAGVRALLPALEGPGAILELGGVGDYYKNFARRGQPYVVTNFAEGQDLILDMTRMDRLDNSIDAFISMFALEHLYDFEAAIEESFRCLKPAGRMLLAVPFMYYYHAAPDDYFRFTASALDRLLNKFSILRRIPYGNRELAVAQFYHEKKILGSKNSWPVRTALRMLSVPHLIAGIAGNQHDPVYAITQLYLCEKPAGD